MSDTQHGWPKAGAEPPPARRPTRSSAHSSRRVKPGAHLGEEYVPDELVLMLGVDPVNFPKFPKSVADGVTFPKAKLDIRQELDVDSGAELADYSGTYRPGLRFTDFSNQALAEKILPWSEAYLLVCIEGWTTEVAKRFGEATMREIEWAAWTQQIAPEVERMKNEFLPAGTTYHDPNLQVREADRPNTVNCHSTCPKSMVVTTKMYNPNMKVDILAIPPRVNEGDVCCKWRLSMRDESDFRNTPPCRSHPSPHETDHRLH